MNLREAAQMALQALQESKPIDINDPTAFYRSAHAIEGLRAALAQPEQEPVAWWHDRGDVVDLNVSGHGTPLYFDPPQREWQGLTDEEIKSTLEAVGFDTWFSYRHAARAIEAKLKEKNS